MIELNDISKIYKNKSGSTIALDKVNIHINKGEFVAIVGQSGSGKTTLMNIIGCYEKSDYGSYYYKGNDISKFDKEGYHNFYNRQAGMIFQNYQLLDYLTVKDNLLLPSLYHKDNRPDKLEKYVKMFDIEECLLKKPNQLSGGEKQRVAIARIMIYDKQLILADEPTASLDEVNSEIIMNCLLKANKEGKTIIMVTHNNELALKCSRIIRLENGHVIS